jgi:hypothetical protein
MGDGMLPLWFGAMRYRLLRPTTAIAKQTRVIARVL